MKKVEISQGLYKEKLHLLRLVEANQYLLCHEVTIPVHIVFHCKETEELCREGKHISVFLMPYEYQSINKCSEDL